MSFTPEQKLELKAKRLLRMRVHDGLVFHWTQSAILAAKGPESVLGFYFDRLGLPQTIQLGSLYGTLVLKFETETGTGVTPFEAGS